jgi:hypothetical protein
MKCLAMALICVVSFAAEAQTVSNSSPLDVKAQYLQRDLKQNHLPEGLYVSIVPVAPPGVRLQHTVDEPGNVIHAGVRTGRYLAGIG